MNRSFAVDKFQGYEQIILQICASRSWYISGYT